MTIVCAYHNLTNCGTEECNYPQGCVIIICSDYNSAAINRHPVPWGAFFVLGNGDSVFSFATHDVLQEHRTLESQQEAKLNILRGIREVVHLDFLLMGNSNDKRMSLSAPYMKGMETVLHSPKFLFSRDTILRVEGVLRWVEGNMRQPTINCLQPTLPYLVRNPRVFDNPRKK